MANARNLRQSKQLEVLMSAVIQSKITDWMMPLEIDLFVTVRQSFRHLISSCIVYLESELYPEFNEIIYLFICLVV